MKRYAGVLLDYAECCFRTNDEATGWEIIKQIRNRAWEIWKLGCRVNMCLVLRIFLM